MDDLISRQAAIKEIEDLPNCYNGYSDTYDKAYIIGVLEELPTAEPMTGLYVDGFNDGYEAGKEDAEPRKGKWETVVFRTVPHDRISKAKKCSVCGKRKDKYVKWNYCPNCGARMEVGAE